MDVRSNVAPAESDRGTVDYRSVSEADLLATCDCAEHCLTVCSHFHLFVVNWLGWYFRVFFQDSQHWANCIMPAAENPEQTDVAALASRVAKRRDAEWCERAASENWSRLVSLTGLDSELLHRIAGVTSDAQGVLNSANQRLGTWVFHGEEAHTAHVAAFWAGCKVSMAVMFINGFVHSANDQVPQGVLHDSTGRPVFNAAQPTFFFEHSNARLIYHGLVERDWLDLKLDAMAWQARLLEERDNAVEWLRSQQRTNLVRRDDDPRSSTIDDRMRAELAENLEVVKGWSCQRWATHLGCAKSTVAETETWKSLALLREKAKAEMAMDRRVRKPKPR